MTKNDIDGIGSAFLTTEEVIGQVPNEEPPAACRRHPSVDHRACRAVDASPRRSEIMNRNHLFVATVVLCAAAFVPASVSAATATANLSVTASVAATCTISTTDVAFGAYDPVVTNLVAPKDGTGK